VKTKVLMLSATPVNNRLADLKNQIAFVTEGDDAALADQGFPASKPQSGRRNFSSIAGSRWRKPTASPPADGHARFRLFQAARPADHRPLAQAHPKILRHQGNRRVPGAAQAYQHQA
jgi:hypothetical protein